MVKNDDRDYATSRYIRMHLGEQFKTIQWSVRPCLRVVRVVAIIAEVVEGAEEYQIDMRTTTTATENNWSARLSESW
jgi:hypothetical protein